MHDLNLGQHDWIDKVRSEGSVPLLEPDQCSTGWCSPPGDIFSVRGADYLTTKAKSPGGDYILTPLGFDWVKGPVKISDVLNNPKGRVRRALQDERSKGRNPFVWAFNLQLPSKDNYSIIPYFVALEPTDDDSLITRFLQGDDEFKKSRLKLIANVAEGPWIVKKAIGEQAICILGRSFTCKYSMGENFLEVDIDVGSSMLATAVVRLVLGYFSTFALDIAFIIEGQSESELPERILGAVRLSHLDLSVASQVELPGEESSENLPSFLPTRFLKSVGPGISHLVHPETQGSDSSTRAGGDVDHDTGSRDAHKQ